MATATATPAGFLTARSVIVIALLPLPILFICFLIGRQYSAERYPSIVVAVEVRAWSCSLVVTKVTSCDDLLRAGGKPKQKHENSSQAFGNKTLAGADLPDSAAQKITQEEHAVYANVWSFRISLW